MKITEALCNVITEAGGTPTAEDAESVTHALGTLYTTLGGTDTLPDDVADRINSLSDHIDGGGGSAPKMGKVTIVNSTSVSIQTFVFRCDSDGNVYAMPCALSASETVESDAPMYKLSEGSAVNDKTAYFVVEARLPKTVSPETLTVATSIGKAWIVRHSNYDNTNNYGYIIVVRSTTSSVTESPVVTISVSA